MKILLTGASGFLGTIIQKVLQKDTINIITIGRNDALLKCDLSSSIPVLPPIDLVIHAAGKAHSVPKTEEQIKEFHDVNVNGTLNLLAGLEQTQMLPNGFVFISSVAVYGQDNGILINEKAELNAKDPYGISKVKAEKIIIDWCEKNNVVCTILRLPLLVGPNPPGNLSAMIKAIQRGYYFNINGGLARKSMVMAEDVALCILPAAKLGGIYNLTDGHHPSFRELSYQIATQINKKPPLNISTWIARSIAIVGNLIGEKSPLNTKKLSKITLDLTFDDSKAKNAFDWLPNSVIKTFKL